jgi:hypothetical protein
MMNQQNLSGVNDKNRDGEINFLVNVSHVRNSKHQAPSTSPAMAGSSSKHRHDPRRQFGIWLLEFFWMLELGIWSFQ